MMEPYCDSDEEVFWGPVTEKEKIIAGRLRRKAMTPKELKASINAVPESSNDGAEGLHALAMAAQMLSISHSEEYHEQDRHSTDQEVPQEISRSVLSSSTNHSKDQLLNKTNEDCPLEMDAVKFLSQRLPEQKNNNGISDDESELFDKTPEHHTSFASSVEDNNGEIAYFLESDLNDPVALPEVSNDRDAVINEHDSYESDSNVCKLENNNIQVKASELDHITVGPHRVNDSGNVESNELYRGPVDHDYFNINETKIIPKEIVEIRAQHQLLPSKEIEVQGGHLEPISATDPLTEFKFTNIDWEAAAELSKSDFEMKISDNEEELEKAERNLKVEEIIKFLSDEEVKTEKKMGSEDDFKSSIKIDPSFQTYNSEQVEHSKKCIKQEFNLERNEMDGCEDFKHSNKKLPSDAILTHETSQSNSKSSVTPIKQEKVDQIYTVKTKEKLIEKSDMIGGKAFIESHKTEKLKTSSKIQVKPLSSGSDLGKNSFHCENSPTTTMVSNQKRLGTPRPPKRSPISNLQCGIPLAYSTTSGNAVNQNRLGTPRPVKKSPINDPSTAYIGIPSAQRSTNNNIFKTPNSKPKSLTMVTKIPHLRSPATPSPRKNKKFAGVVSPVAQYIHGNPVLLISNNKPLKAPKSYIPCPSKPISSKAPPETSLPEMVQERGAENIDMNNVSDFPLPGNVYYKSALPVQIHSTSPSHIQKNGPTVIVTKHLGRVKIDEIRRGNADPLQPRESLMPGGEVSLLVSKEIGLLNN